MEKKELLKNCKYYKGEDECPFDSSPKYQEQGLFWEYERKWYEASENDILFLKNLINEYNNNGFANFNDDGVPISLKSLLLNRYSHWNGTNAGFKSWYLNKYKSLQ